MARCRGSLPVDQGYLEASSRRPREKVHKRAQDLSNRFCNCLRSLLIAIQGPLADACSWLSLRAILKYSVLVPGWLANFQKIGRRLFLGSGRHRRLAKRWRGEAPHFLEGPPGHPGATHTPKMTDVRSKFKFRILSLRARAARRPTRDAGPGFRFGLWGRFLCRNFCEPGSPGPASRPGETRPNCF